MLDERELPDRLRALRGMDLILPVLEGAPDCYLVGGAVRDLLLGREPVDIDIAVEGDAEAVAERLAEALGGEVIAHERFGTATLVARGVDAVNLAQTRRESYAEPGALPEVEAAGLAEDLGRRDFTVNAMALALGPDDRLGVLSDSHGGREDLREGLIRVLHSASFSDDPTRLLRAVRYAARLGFVLEADTERWARAAVADGAPTTVSGSRIRDELIDLLAENDAPRAVGLLFDLGIDRALHSDLRADPELVASAKLGAAETGADPALTALAALATDCLGGLPGAAARPRTQESDGDGDGLASWVDRLGLSSRERDAALGAARRAPAIVNALRHELRPSQLRTLLDGEPPEALALALALGAPAAPILDFTSRLSAVRLEITGADLLAAGVPESPALGRALEVVLERKLDGEVDGRDEELRAALDFASGDGVR